VLIDAASGQGPGTLARKLSRRAPYERSEIGGASLPAGRQGGYGVLFALMVQSLLVSSASRYKSNRARNLSPVTRFDASQSAIAVLCTSNLSRCRGKSKNHDELIYFIDRVSISCSVKLSWYIRLLFMAFCLK
jgi:hypothetical protein